jgi:hypothetical protein
MRLIEDTLSRSGAKLVRVAACGLVLCGGSSSLAEISFTEDGTAQITNGALQKDLDRWRVGDFNGWGGCMFVKLDPQTKEEICGCLGRQRSEIGPAGVLVAVEKLQPCASLFIHGVWNSNWGQTVGNQAPVSFNYDANSKKITGCWTEPAGGGRVTGSLKDGSFSARQKSFSFTYHDALRHVSGRADLILANTPQLLTLLGSWMQEGGLGAWSMFRDPIRTPLACAEDQAPTEQNAPKN